MEINDTIEFFNEDFPKKKFIVKIIKGKFNTFEKYIRTKTLKKTLPGINNVKEGLDIYYKYYSKDDEEKYKIIAIDIKLI